MTVEALVADKSYFQPRRYPFTAQLLQQTPTTDAQGVLGLDQMDKSPFTTSFDVWALRIPAKDSHTFLKTLSSVVLQLPRQKSILTDPTSNQHRLLLLNETWAHQEDVMASLPRPIQDFLSAYPHVTPIRHTIELGYSFWNADQILRAIFPLDLDVPGAFETVGHIAHFNLREHYLPFKYIIGQVILDKCSRITTVVNKTDGIDHTFRFFKMELLAGKDDLKAELAKSDCIFKFDFSRVYWNSRLQGEHERIVKKIAATDATESLLVCDVFAGIGPFALPMAKQTRSSSIIFANDLNPASYEYLVGNIQHNRVEDKIVPLNLDGRECITTSLRMINSGSLDDPWKVTLCQARERYEEAKRKKRPEREHPEAPLAPLLLESVPRFNSFQHYIMNLPATAIEFLDAFIGLYVPYKHLLVDKEIPLPIVHCHCFSRADDLEADVIERVSQGLHYPADSLKKEYLVDMFQVRDVAPKKMMMCISFKVPASVLLRESLKRPLDKDTEATQKTTRIH